MSSRFLAAAAKPLLRRRHLGLLSPNAQFTNGFHSYTNVGGQYRLLSDLPSIACTKLIKKHPHHDFSFDVAKHLLHEGLQKTPQQNLLCSPFSTNAVINMLVPGTTGQTLDQFLELLECKNEEKFSKSASRLIDVAKASTDGPKMAFRNAVWVDEQYPLRKPYAKLLEKVHKADVEVVDFQNKADEVTEEIDQWAKQRTKGMIKSILPETCYHNDTVMILASAYRFKLESPDALNSKASLYYCGSIGGCQVLRMQYKDANSSTGSHNQSFSMYIFVPTKEHGLPNFLEGMKADPETFEKQIKAVTELVSNIRIPRFNLESKLPLHSTMKQLGLTLPFKASQSELTKFIDSPLADLLYVTDVTQKCSIETNDRGTTVSAVTYATLCGPTIHPVTSIPPQLNYVADNPFMFMIREDHSGAVISAGTMLSADLSSYSSASS